jgi:hypothetical protein
MKRRIISMLVAVAMFLALPPLLNPEATLTEVSDILRLNSALNAGGEIILGNDIISSNYGLVVNRDSTLHLNGYTLECRTITINPGVTLTITDCLLVGDSPGTGRLIATARSISVPAIQTTDATLIIESGYIEAIGVDNTTAFSTVPTAAAIGGRSITNRDDWDRANGGTVIINGGTIIATAGNCRASNSIGIPGIVQGSSGAGIGGGGGATASGNGSILATPGGNGGTVIINGGNITATGGTGSGSGAGIGGGGGGNRQLTDDASIGSNGGDGGSFIINGGIVYAYGGNNAAGIGGGSGGGEANQSGRGGNGGEVTINGGAVRAEGSEGGAGIGGGGIHESENAIHTHREGGGGGKVTINDGNVTAIGGERAAGIGGGGSDVVNDGRHNAGDVTITGGNITAYGGSSAIGRGNNGKDGTVSVLGVYDYWTSTTTTSPATATGSGMFSWNNSFRYIKLELTERDPSVTTAAVTTTPPTTTTTRITTTVVTSPPLTSTAPITGTAAPPTSAGTVVSPPTTASLPTVTTTPDPPDTYVYTINDALNILKHLAKLDLLTAVQVTRYDFFNNGSITINNALEILKHLAKLESLIP